MDFAAVSNRITPKIPNSLQKPETGHICLHFQASNEPFKDAARTLRGLSSDSKYSVVTRLALHFPPTKEEDSQLETCTHEPSATSEIGPGLQGVTDLLILFGPILTHESVESRFDQPLVTRCWAGLMQYMPNVTTLKCNASVPRIACIAETAPKVGTRHPIRFCNTNQEVAEAMCDVYLDPILPDDAGIIWTTTVEILKGFNPDKDLDIQGTCYKLMSVAVKATEGQFKKTLKKAKCSVISKDV